MDPISPKVKIVMNKRILTNPVKIILLKIVAGLGRFTTQKIINKTTTSVLIKSV